jgi:hypothetical protein
MRIFALLTAAFAALVALPAFAQNPPEGTPTRVRGAIEQLDGQKLTVKPRDRSPLVVELAPNFTVSALVKKNLADIKEGDYVASAGIKGADGRIHAVEVRIFPEALRGTAEGQFPWDLSPDSIMTNATVSGIASAPEGKVLKVTYKGTTSEIIVPPDCPVFAYVSGDASLLKPGAAVFMVATKKPDGSLTAARVTAEKDGVKPPM